MNPSDVNSPALALYYKPTCPYCIRVLEALEDMGRVIELRNINADRAHYYDLVQGGGKGQVPCLRIASPDGSVSWLYESLDIIAYLQSH
ncbi:MAG: glutaredoxin [Planctomycetes bacterium]|nr:glutaredoxin [Planctomycetota bacterium]